MNRILYRYLSTLIIIVKISVHLSANRVSIEKLILMVGLLTTVSGLIVSQTIFVSEVNAAKKIEVECDLIASGTTIEKRICCEYEIDTETGEERQLDCWYEYCNIETGECKTEEPFGNNIPNGIDRPIDEGVVLPTPDDSTPGGITKGQLEEQKLFPIPQETTTFGDGITGRIPDQAGILPIPPEITSQEENDILDQPIDEGAVSTSPPPSTSEDDGGISKGTTPLQLSPLVVEEDDSQEIKPQPVECNEGEIFNEQTGQCGSVEEPEVEEE
jgi:hypothetical protein